LLPGSLKLFQSTLEYRLNHTQQALLANPRHLKRLQELLRSARKEILSWTDIPHGWQALGPGSREIYAAARSAAAATDSKEARDDLALHESRKRAKDLLHVLEFLRKVDPEDIGERVRVVHQLTDLLGEDHDLAVMQALLEGPLQRYLAKLELQRLSGIIAERRHVLQHRAVALSRTVYGDDDLAFAKKLHRSWNEWRAGRGARRKAASVVRIRTSHDVHRLLPRGCSSP
jgi:CHAD domain-containing protein